MARKKKGQGNRSFPNPNSKKVEAGDAELEEIVRKRREQENAAVGTVVAANMKMPLSVLARKLRVGLSDRGTNVAQNDNDPMGDGDQSVLEDKRQRLFHRALFDTRGDVANCVTQGGLSVLFVAAMCGDVATVEAMLKKAEGGVVVGGTPPPDLVALLETRETSMRLTPLLWLATMGKCFGAPDEEGIDDEIEESVVAVAKLLLKYGARPDARDVVGKTVFHYGAGGFATDMTLAVADLCLQAHDGGSHLFGKSVTLVNLSNEAMNGLEGIALGFDVDTGRRLVTLPDVNNLGRYKKVAVKPQNLRLAATDTGDEQGHGWPLARLCDIQDRLGEVSLMEVIDQHRQDVAKFLLERRARLDIVDFDGTSPLSMSSTPGMQLSNPVCRLIIEHAASTARRNSRKLCSNCGKDEKDAPGTFDLCSGCKVTRYCSTECQLRHWKAAHKGECPEIQAKKNERVVLGRLSAGMKPRDFLTRSHAWRSAGGGSYRMPRGVQVGEKFTVKVEVSTTRNYLVIYNEARDCTFCMRPDQAGYSELFDVVVAEKVTNGTQTYMKALFDEEGNCVAFPGDTRMHTW